MITDPSPVTRRLAVTLVTAAMRGDPGTVRALLLAADPDEFAVLVQSVLSLARAIAVNLRTPRGLLAADLWLAECARDHPCRDTRLGAELILAHEAIAAAGSDVDLLEIAVGEYNRVCCTADDRFCEVLTAAMVSWHSLLTEAGTVASAIMVGNTAAELWGSAEPAPIRTAAPKSEETGTTVKFKNQENGPPQPTLAIPPEAAVVERRPQPRAILPPGAPVSLRGLAARRLQERGIDCVYG